MKLFCRHEWEQIKGTGHLYDMGRSKGAHFKCIKCGKKRWFDVFNIRKNKYVFKEYTKGSISDGSHTFDELYYHRMVLFSIICSQHKDLAWKSWKHHDGTMYEDYFIVGIDTPEGQYSYHYHKDNWDKFDVPEMKHAPMWDGHTPSDIDRLLSLKYKDNLTQLFDWLRGERYLIDEMSTTMTEEFEREHRHELSSNLMINKVIIKINQIRG